MLSASHGRPQVTVVTQSRCLQIRFPQHPPALERGDVFFGKTAQKLAIRNLKESLKTLNFQRISGFGWRHGDCYFRAFFPAVPEAKR
jgi:hypothetical protein